jgi:hypothetical protein
MGGVAYFLKVLTTYWPLKQMGQINLPPPPVRGLNAKFIFHRPAGPPTHF